MFCPHAHLSATTPQSVDCKEPESLGSTQPRLRFHRHEQHRSGAPWDISAVRVVLVMPRCRSQRQTQSVQTPPQLLACRIDGLYVTHRESSLLLDIREIRIGGRPIVFFSVHSLPAIIRPETRSVPPRLFRHDVLNSRRHSGGRTIGALIAPLPKQVLSDFISEQLALF